MSANVARIPAAAALLALLIGCGGGLRSGAAPDRIYILHAASNVTTGEPLAAVLSVPRPTVYPGLDTDRIALLRAGNELDYFAASRYGESLPKVLGAAAQQALSGGDGFVTTISAERAAVHSDYELLLTARRFEAEYEDGTALPRVQVMLDCVLVAGAPRTVLGRCDGTATEAVSANRMSEIVSALERATQQALAQVRAKAVAMARAAPVRK